MRKQGMYSLICDGTQDEGKKEAVCVIVCYVEYNVQDTEENLKSVERLVGMFTTGEAFLRVYVDT